MKCQKQESMAMCVNQSPGRTRAKPGVKLYTISARFWKQNFRARRKGAMQGSSARAGCNKLIRILTKESERRMRHGMQNLQRPSLYWQRRTLPVVPRRQDGHRYAAQLWRAAVACLATARGTDGRLSGSYAGLPCLPAAVSPEYNKSEIRFQRLRGQGRAGCLPKT